MCGTKCHVDATSSIPGATSRVQHLMFLVIMFTDTIVAYVLFIMLHVTRAIIVLDSLYYLINTTWGWGDMTVD